MCRGPYHGIFCFLLVLCSTACTSWNQRGAKGVGLLPKAGTGEQHFSNYEPSNPYVQLGEGIYYRKRYEGAGPAGLRVEVRDLLVGPSQHSAKVSLPGAAICEVNSGSGVLTSGDQPQELRSGATFALPEGASFSIENKSDTPISIRVHLLRAE
jgi:hypothetical protein